MVNEASWIVLLRLRHPRNPNEAAGASLVTITRAIGDVGALARTEFPIQRLGFIADGRSTFLVAHPLAGQSFRSEQFMFPSGGIAVWTIENQSGLSHVSVR